MTSYSLRVYLTNRFSANKYFYDAYFCVKYYDHARQQKLFLFVYKGELFGGYQEYEVRGICLPKDWNINLEESGTIRVWLNKVDDKIDYIWDRNDDRGTIT